MGINLNDLFSLTGLHGILLGAGEIVGGCLFGVLGHLTSASRRGRDPIVILGLLVHVGAFCLAFVNLPDTCPFGETGEAAIIASSIPLALMASFLMGFGDACFNTQIYSLLGGVYAQNSAPAFAILK